MKTLKSINLIFILIIGTACSMADYKPESISKYQAGEIETVLLGTILQLESVVIEGNRDLVRLRKGYEIEVTEKLYSNEVLKVKLLDGRYKGRFYYAIADDLTKKYLLEEKEEENEDS